MAKSKKPIGDMSIAEINSEIEKLGVEYSSTKNQARKDEILKLRKELMEAERTRTAQLQAASTAVPPSGPVSTAASTPSSGPAAGAPPVPPTPPSGSGSGDSTPWNQIISPFPPLPPPPPPPPPQRGKWGLPNLPPVLDPNPTIPHPPPRSFFQEPATIYPRVGVPLDDGTPTNAPPRRRRRRGTRTPAPVDTGNMGFTGSMGGTGPLTAMMAGIDPMFASLGGNNRGLMAAQIARQSVTTTGNKLFNEDPMGAAGSAIGGGMKSIGMATGNPLVMGLGALVEAVGGATGKMLEWGETLHKNNIRFAEFSAAMTQVQVQQEIRDIQFSQERGNARAATAEQLAQSWHGLREALAPIQDDLMNGLNEMFANLSQMMIPIVQWVTRQLKISVNTGTDPMVGHMGGIDTTMRRAVNAFNTDLFDGRGRPRRFRSDV